MQVTTTLTGYQSKSGTSARGPWVLHIFTDAGVQEYSSFKQEHYAQLSTKVGTGQPVTLLYESKQDSYGEKRTITHIVPDTAPAGQQIIPQANQPGPVQTLSGVVAQQEKESRIMWGNAGNMAANLLAPLAGAGESVGLTALHRLQWDIYQHLLKGPRPVEENIQWSDPQPSDGIPY